MSETDRMEPVWCRARFRRHAAIAALVVATVLLTACTEDGLLRGSVVLEGTHDLASGSGHVAVLGGTARVAEGATIDGTVVLLGDVLVVDGAIVGDVLLFGGNTEIGPRAIVEGSIVVAGGGVAIDPSATLLGGMREDLDLLAELARPAPTALERLTTLAVQSLLLAALAALAAAMAPAPVRRMSDALSEHPVVAGSMGMLAGLVATVLLVIMAFTVVLIPVTLVVALALVAAIALGWIAIGRGLAARFVRARGGEVVGPAAVAAGTVTTALGLAVVDWIPVVGSLLALAVTVIGFGAVLITGFGTRRFVPDAGAEADRMRAGNAVPPGREG